MELRLYWKVLLRRWWLVVVPVLVVAIYTAATYTPPGPVYQVTMRFAAGTKPEGLSEDYDRYYPWLTSEYVANGLADAARTGAFAEAVAARLEDPSLAAVRRLDTPSPIALAPGLRTQLMGPAVKIGLAAGTGVALALLWHYLDPTVREAKELEELGLPVLAEIPRK
jgi:capsular polysaccharide biosynthesis protein